MRIRIPVSAAIRSRQPGRLRENIERRVEIPTILPAGYQLAEGRSRAQPLKLLSLLFASAAKSGSAVDLASGRADKARNASLFLPFSCVTT
jgi:hypothetical protein